MKRTGWMKRGLLWVACLVLLLCTVSAQAITIPEAVGRWYFIAAGDKGLSGKDYLELNRDRSVTLMVGENAVNTNGITWEIDKYSENEINIKQADGRILFNLKYEGTNLKCLTDRLSSVFNLSSLVRYTLSKEAIVYDTPEAQKAEKEDQFFGDYEHYLSVNQEKYTVVNSGERKIEVAEYVLTEISKDKKDKTDYLTDFKDGVLHVYAKDEWIYSVTSDPNVLVAYSTADESGEHRYFRRVGASANTAE